MNVLAFDTTLGACSAAVIGEGARAPEVFSVYEAREREHAEHLMPMIGQVLEQAGLRYEALDAIAVTTGPGSFTGVRVGVAAARGLALATGVPLIGVTSLEVMAHCAMTRLSGVPHHLAIIVDARRGEVYMAVFTGSGEVVSEPQALTPAQALDELPENGRVTLAGGGAHLVAMAAAEKGRSLEAVLPDLQPDAAVLARMALTRPPQDGPLHPLYLRPPDAKPQTGKSLPRRG